MTDEPGMANWARKVGRAARHELQPGERLLEGVFVLPAGTQPPAGASVAADPAGAAVDAGIAATLPRSPTVLGLTDRRLLVFDHGRISGRPKDLLLALPTGDLETVRIEQRKSSYRLVLQFGDGTAGVYEAPRTGNDPEAFAAAVDAR